MADPTATEPGETATEPAAGVVAPAEKKKSSRPRKAKAASSAISRKKGADTGSSDGDASASTARTGRKVHSAQERARKLAHIEKATKSGETLKNAVKQAAISEQTYYHWKKAAAPAPTSDELADLIALEKENKRLKSLLAERLRKENAELKRKLGLQ